jgi:hypothetical protein
MSVVAVAASLLLIAFGTAAGAAATSQTGDVSGKVLGPDGAPLPGVTVTLDTAAGTEARVTDARGKFSFLGLPLPIAA